jgi:hypothetical protein
MRAASELSDRTTRSKVCGRVFLPGGTLLLTALARLSAEMTDNSRELFPVSRHQLRKWLLRTVQQDLLVEIADNYIRLTKH